MRIKKNTKRYRIEDKMSALKKAKISITYINKFMKTY